MMLTNLGLVEIFLLMLLKSTEANERPAVTPQAFELAFPKIMDWIQKTLLAHQRFARAAAEALAHKFSDGDLATRLLRLKHMYNKQPDQDED
jgi:hypothetical protein